MMVLMALMAPAPTAAAMSGQPSRLSVALADCNNFYASCELVFRPHLVGRPVVVVGNNDGCVIARSREAKRLSVPMGAPLYSLAPLIRQHGIVVCSANFALYADMSSRVYAVLCQFAEHSDRYSIDEAFLDLSFVPPDERAAYAATIRAAVLRCTGITVSIGVASTKTLAKAAAEVAKTRPESGGVVTLGSAIEAAALLRSLPVADVWGVGPKRAALLRAHGIRTAADLARADPGWVRRHLTVAGSRTQLELRGVACIPLVEQAMPRKQIMHSRAFGQPVTELRSLRQAVASFTERAATRARTQQSAATHVAVFLTTNVFRTAEPQYHPTATLTLPRATNDPAELLAHILPALARIYRPGYHYHKAGVLLGGFRPEQPEQGELWAPGRWRDPRRRAVLRVMDAINGRFGRGTIRLLAGLPHGRGGAAGVVSWPMRQATRSPRYTTRWAELLMVR